MPGENMTLCCVCQSIPFHDLPEPPAQWRGSLALSGIESLQEFLNESRHQSEASTRHEDDLGFPHQSTVVALYASAIDCGLCRLLKQSVESFVKLVQGGRNARPLTAEEPSSRDMFGTWDPDQDFSLWLTKRLDGGKGFLAFTPSASPQTSIYLVGAIGFCVDDDSPLASEFPGRPVCSPGSEEISLKRAGAWLKECLETHSHCQQPSVDAELPSRVLDLECAAGRDDVRLLETNGQRGRYISLSHCWGETGHFTTTRDTMADRKRRIRLDELPKTFQDAVVISRRFCIRYLWIDSLCICQDDEEDWAHESAKMAQVYENSIITVAASGAENSTNGCFVPRADRDFVSLYLRGTIGQHVHAFSIPLSRAAASWRYLELADEPLNKRAWALQERVMSRRVLHCATDQMYYECNGGFRSEDGFGTWRRPDSICTSPPQGFPVVEETFEVEETHRLWENLLREYTTRRLTVPTDRLPALSGIARIIAKRLKAEYVAGLWSDSLIDNLAWHVVGRSRGVPPQPMCYIAPSFSWASYPGMSAAGNHDQRQVATLLDWHITHEDDNPFGRVYDGWVRVRAPLIPLRESDAIDKETWSSARTLQLITPWGRREGTTACFDNITGQEARSHMPLFGLVLFEHAAKDSGFYYIALVLMKDEGKDGMRRLGIMQIHDPESGRPAVIEETEKFATVKLV